MSKLLSNKKGLIIYASSQTYTETVFEHLNAFKRYSQLSWSFIDFKQINNINFNTTSFDVIVVHYSVRIAFGQIDLNSASKLSSFSGSKVLFIQDEYDNVNFTKSMIKAIGFDLVFTCVPKSSINKIYPKSEFSKKVKFVNNFTGYVPSNLEVDLKSDLSPSKRNLIISYRGRLLKIRYGTLGIEKSEIGRVFKNYCETHRIRSDIEWGEESRIYGTNWYKFIKSSRCMLGTESGSNVFDWDGTLQSKIDQYIKTNSKIDDSVIYQKFIKPLEKHGLMNQISPRIFEMAAAKTLMVLMEGSYSGVIKPYKHYLPVKKDYSNITEIIDILVNNNQQVDSIADNAYDELISSGKYSYKNFILMVDNEIANFIKPIQSTIYSFNFNFQNLLKNKITSKPQKAKSPIPYFLLNNNNSYKIVSTVKAFIVRCLLFIWYKIPVKLRPLIKFLLRRK